MKLLISAYACAPNLGSDHGVGWNWVREANRLGHQIWVLASPAHRECIEAAKAADLDLQRINWLFPEVHGWKLSPGKEPTWERTYNFLWQRAARWHARKLLQQIKFDFIHHLTWAGIRAPTYLGGLGPPLIIGPVGGGETSPQRLRRGLSWRGRALETLRDISTHTIAYNPLVRPGLRDASVIFASTRATRDIFPGSLRRKTAVFSQLALDELPRPVQREASPGRLRLLYAGRLLYWKGVDLALQSIADAGGRGGNVHLTVVGDGPERSRLLNLAARLHVTDRVTFIPRLPQAAFLAMCDHHDVLLFPSLHDSGGLVVLEAMARGMPAVVLDLGGPADLVTSTSGAVIATGSRSRHEVSRALADCLISLLEDTRRLQALSRGARARACEFLLPGRITALYRISAGHITKSSKQVDIRSPAVGVHAA